MFLRIDGSEMTADRLLRSFAEPRVDRWVRTERLVEDLADAFRLQPGAVAGILKTQNRNRIDYIKDLRFWFTQDELSCLYSANPFWAEIEQKVYGDILTAP